MVPKPPAAGATDAALLPNILPPPNADPPGAVGWANALVAAFENMFPPATGFVDGVPLPNMGAAF